MSPQMMVQNVAYRLLKTRAMFHTPAQNTLQSRTNHIGIFSLKNEKSHITLLQSLVFLPILMLGETP